MDATSPIVTNGFAGQPPLSRWLICRPEAEAGRTVSALRALGADGLVAPILTINPLPVGEALWRHALRHGRTWLFTSRNGVRGLSDWLAGRPAAERRQVEAWPVYAVGGATAAAATAAGYTTVISADGDARDLAKCVIRDASVLNGILVHACGMVGGEALPNDLAAHGLTVHRVPVYTAILCDDLPSVVRDALRDLADKHDPERPAAAPLAGVLFFSPRTAEGFARLVSHAGCEAGLHQLAAVCISQATADRLNAANWGKCLVAPRPTLDGLISCVRSVLLDRDLAIPHTAG